MYSREEKLAFADELFRQLSSVNSPLNDEFRCMDGRSDEFNSMIESLMIGASLALIAKPGKPIHLIAKKTKSPSRRMVFHGIRLMTKAGSNLRKEVEEISAEGRKGDADINAHIVAFARNVEIYQFA
jgi:hypothetical protein